MDIVEELKRRVEEVYGGHGTVLEYPDDLCARAAGEIELLRSMVQVEREIQTKILKERDHWFKLVPHDVGRENPFHWQQ